MAAIIRFLINALLRGPQEFLVALLRLLLLLLLFIPVLLLKFWELISWLLRTKSLYPEETEGGCGRIPETVVRRPDPAIYSQQYLMSQGLPVTWNNPGIWLAPADNPGAVEPDSYHLKDDTDYIVSVRAHNASTDAAIGVKVRLVYRPWSFNSPNLVPVETDAAGNEVFKFVDISPMGAAIARFTWHTPKLEPGQQQHYCLQAHLSHPLDINLANNMGQENTQVYSQNPGFVAPGEIVEFEIPLFNVGRQAANFRFRWDRYEINFDDEVQLRLKTLHGRARLPQSGKLGHILPTVSPPVPMDREPARPGSPASSATSAWQEGVRIFGKVNFGSPKSLFRIAKTKYTGYEALRDMILSRDYSLPAGMAVTVADVGGEGLRLNPKETHLLKLTVKIPDDAPATARYPLNVIAERSTGAPVGGVTFYFQVRE